jgi:D-alanine-D-alanine ligase
MDFRVNDKGEVFFLEVNFTCSVFYTDGYEGSADFILKYDGIGQAGFLKLIIEEAMNRHERKQKCYDVKGNSMLALHLCKTNYHVATLFNGEEIPATVTRRHAMENWNENEQEHLPLCISYKQRSFYYLGCPTEWAPTGCDPNCAYDGLDVVALRKLKKAKITLDYAQF